jgi:hypothetical protein
MTLHILKTVEPYFEAQWEGKKTFEVRIADRNYKGGDYILSRQYDPDYALYSGRQILLKVPYFLHSQVSLPEILGDLDNVTPFVVMATEMIWKIALDPATGAAVDLARQSIDELEGVAV